VRLLRAFVRHELTTQTRSLRYRTTASLYLAVSIVPLALYRFVAHREQIRFDPTSAAGLANIPAPMLTALLAAILSVDGITREQDEGSLPVVGLTAMSSTGYLLRRWLALLATILPLTLVPVAGAAAFAATSGPVDWPSVAGAFLWPWLLHTVPIALVASAFSLGIGTIAGGMVAAAVSGYFVFSLSLMAINTFGVRFGRVFEGPREWIGGEQATLVSYDFIEAVANGWYAPPSATSLPAGAGSLWERLLPLSLYAIGVAAVCLGAAAAMLRRTRPNLRPLVVPPTHPFKTFVRFLNRFRESYGPDPALLRRDRAMVLGGLVLFAACVTHLFLRDATFRRIGALRYAAEMDGGPVPTDPALRPGAWKITGSIRGNGRYEASIAFEMRNEGNAPASHLAFSLDPDLEIGDFTSSGRPVRWTRRWDRLAVEIDPLPPGSSRLFSISLSGTPKEWRLELPRGSFPTAWEQIQEAKISFYLSDLSRSSATPLVDRRQLRLTGSSLTPVPRYSSWKLTRGAAKSKTGDPEASDRVVLSEWILHPASLSIDLATPEGLFVADSCGDVVRPAAGEGRLSGACALPLDDLLIRGGALVEIPTPGIGAFAVIPSHRDLAEKHASTLSAAADLARGGWPGLDPFPSTVFVEWAPEGSLNPFQGMQYWWNRSEYSADIRERLVSIPERIFVHTEQISAERLAAEILASHLARRRTVVPEERLFFRKLLQTLALARLGGGGITSGVTESPFPVSGSVPPTPLLQATSGDGEVWEGRLPRILIDLRGRVGERVLSEAVDEFLAGGNSTGTARELIDLVSRKSGRDLRRFYEDFIAGNAHPELTLEGVAIRKVEGGFEATGSLQNRWTGEVSCPLVLRTDLDPVKEIIRVGDRESVPFRLRSRHRPRALFLDPDGACFRNKPKAGVVDRVEYRGES
jgi:hypothetical protein